MNKGISFYFGFNLNPELAAKLIKEAGFNVERRQVYLEKAIKDLGVYEVKLNLHPEISQSILVNVARTDDEAAKQAKAYSAE